MATKKAPSKKTDKPKRVRLTDKQKKFLDLLKENLGIVSKAADDMNIHRNTHYSWMKNPAYAEQVKAIEDDCIDVVENQLMNNILAGDVASIIFYLKTKARKRGYNEKLEVGMTDNQGNDVEPKKQVIVIGGKEIVF